MAKTQVEMPVGPTLTNEELENMALAQGASLARVISPRTVKTARWVRWKCQFGCGVYGSSMVCPPHTPLASQTRRMLDEYQVAVLFESPDGKTKRIAASMERELFLAGDYRAFGMGSGPCDLCEVCAFDAGCRHPHQARPAMEACGIDVFTTARRHGFELNVVRTHREPQHYFGLVLVR
jgi:predicted metal-binding protein